MSDSSEPTADTDWRARIRAVGLRATAPRVAVLRILQEMGRPATHAEVTETLAAGGWDRATLYRNPTDLAEAGVLTRTDLGDHVWRYEIAGAPHSAHDAVTHPHFLCTSCGDVTCLPEIALPAGPGKLPTSVRQGKVEVQVRGLCDDCEPG